MPAFQYKAIDKLGRPARGKLDAANEVDLELRLKRMGLDLITFRAMPQRYTTLAKGSVTRRDLIAFCFDLEQISRSGIPVIEGLRDLRDGTENPRFREMLSSVLEDIEGGKMLSQGLAAFPNVFGSVFVSLVQSRRAIRPGHRGFREPGRRAEVARRVGVADAQAADLSGDGPHRGHRRRDVPAALPRAAGRDAAQEHGHAAAAADAHPDRHLELRRQLLVRRPHDPDIAVAGIAYFISTDPKGQYYFDYIKLRLPITGAILQKIILARFANFFALMYQSGITILDAIKTSEEIVGNRVIADGLQRAGQQINAGESMSEAFGNLGLFPPLVIRMMRVGENTGALDTALLNISYFYTRDVREAIDKALKLLEPTMTLVLGGILALILFSVLTPIYDILGKIKV